MTNVAQSALECGFPGGTRPGALGRQHDLLPLLYPGVICLLFVYYSSLLIHLFNTLYYSLSTHYNY